MHKRGQHLLKSGPGIAFPTPGRGRLREFPAWPGGTSFRTRGAGLCLVCQVRPCGMDILNWLQDNQIKGVTTMTLPMFTQPGQVSGAQLGQALFQFLPALPGEGPPGMPRAMAKAFFPRGFNPFQPFPAAAPPVQPAALIPPAPAPAVPPVDARGNQIQRREPATAAIPQPAPPAPAPQPAPQGYRPTQSGGNPIRASSQRIRITERNGM